LASSRAGQTPKVGAKPFSSIGKFRIESAPYAASVASSRRSFVLAAGCPPGLTRSGAMPSPIYNLFRNAILAEQQVVCSYDGRPRELCPHIIGTNKYGEEVVLAWQFAGESSSRLPQWRCLKLAHVKDARARAGRRHEGGSHKTAQTCVTAIDLDINVHVRKLR
jgi:hypothetical protein